MQTYNRHQQGRLQRLQVTQNLQTRRQTPEPVRKPLLQNQMALGQSSWLRTLTRFLSPPSPFPQYWASLNKGFWDNIQNLKIFPKKLRESGPWPWQVGTRSLKGLDPPQRNTETVEVSMTANYIEPVNWISLDILL